MADLLLNVWIDCHSVCLSAPLVRHVHCIYGKAETTGFASVHRFHLPINEMITVEGWNNRWFKKCNKSKASRWSRDVDVSDFSESFKILIKIVRRHNFYSHQSRWARRGHFVCLPGRRATNTFRAHSGSCMPGFYKRNNRFSSSASMEVTLESGIFKSHVRPSMWWRLFRAFSCDS